MTPHKKIFEVLGGLADGRVFPGIADLGTPTPYVTFRVISAPQINFVTGEKPAKRFVRVQVNVWARTSVEAFEVAMQAEDAIRSAADLQPEVLSGAVDTYDDVVKCRGAMQDFQMFI